MAKTLKFMTMIVECGADPEQPEKVGMFYQVQEQVGDDQVMSDRTYVKDAPMLTETLSTTWDQMKTEIKQREGIT